MEMQETPNTPHMRRGGEHGRHEHHRRAKGGKAPVQEYNAQGSNEAREAEDEDPDFKRGGKARKRKAGGHAEGEHSKHRSDRAPRGRAEHEKRKAGGRMHEGHGAHHHEHEHEAEHDGDHGHAHHGAHGHVAAHHGDGDIHMHMHKKRGGEAREHEKRARGGRTGHSPYSSGRMLKDEQGSTGAASGREGQRVPSEPG